MTTILEMIMECFEDTILQILIAAAIVSTIVGVIKDGYMGLIEGGSILAAIVIIVGITTGNNYKKEKQFQEL
jgi:Ca2+ transporting ATPase